MWIFVLIERLFHWWLDPVPGLADLSQTNNLLECDIESLLAERGLQTYDQVNPYL